MSKSSEMHLALMEAEQNQEQMDKIVQELSDVNLKDYDQKLKETRAESKEAKKPKTKSVDGKALIVKSICEKITPLGQKFGNYSWRIDMAGNWSCYLNSKVDGIAEKLFKEGSACALTLEEKNKWLIVKQVFYTF